MYDVIMTPVELIFLKSHIAAVNNYLLMEHPNI